MNKTCALYVFVVLSNIQFVYSQSWTPADSIRLQRILSGKDSLRLNPEVQRMIRDGNFINPGEKKLPTEKSLFTDPEEIGISKLKPEDPIWKKERTKVKLPGQSTFGPYGVELPEPEYKISDKLLDFMGDVKQTKLPKSHDFNDILSTIFDPEYRRMKKNRQNANAYKIYNDLPSLETLEKRKQYLEAHPEAVPPERKKEAIVQEKDSANVK